MMPTSGNFEGQQQQGPNQGSSLMGFLQSPGTLMQGYDQVPGDMSAGLSNHAARLFNKENLRSPAAMFGSGDNQPFSLMLSPQPLLERVRHNINFFYLNYMVLTAAIFVVNVFFSPSSWLGMLFLAVLWIAMINTVTDERLQKIGTLGLGIFSLLVMWWLLPLKWTFYVSGTLIIAHLLFRDASSMQMQHDPMTGIPDNAGFYQGPQLVGA